MVTRAKALLAAMVIYLVGLTLCGALLGVRNLYAGEPPLASGERVTGTARVGECVRSGPVSSYGFGYWWDCEVTISLPDGRQTTVAVDRSIVTPDDRDRPVELIGRCTGVDQDECSFTRDGNLFLAVLRWLAGLLVVILLLVTGLIGGSALLVALLGPDLAERWFGRWSRPPAPAAGSVPAAGPPLAGGEAPAGVEPPTGTGALRLSFDYPDRIATVYEGARPRLWLDGKEVAVSDWSPQTYPLAPGPHRIRIRTVLNGGMAIGGIQQTVPILDGVETIAGYEAPVALSGPGVLRVGSVQDAGDAEPGVATERTFQISFGRLVLAVVPLNLAIFCLLSEFL